MGLKEYDEQREFLSKLLSSIEEPFTSKMLIEQLKKEYPNLNTGQKGHCSFVFIFIQRMIASNKIKVVGNNSRRHRKFQTVKPEAPSVTESVVGISEEKKNEVQVTKTETQISNLYVEEAQIIAREISELMLTFVSKILEIRNTEEASLVEKICDQMKVVLRTESSSHLGIIKNALDHLKAHSTRPIDNGHTDDPYQQRLPAVSSFNGNRRVEYSPPFSKRFLQFSSIEKEAILRVVNYIANEGNDSGALQTAKPKALVAHTPPRGLKSRVTEKIRLTWSRDEDALRFFLCWHKNETKRVYLS